MKQFIIGVLMFVSIITMWLNNDPVIYADVDPPKDRKYYEAHQEIWWERPIHKKWIALTFDDGPSSKITEEVLLLLRQHQAKATFFCLGYKVKRYPEIAKQMVSEGHEIGNHTYYHNRLNRLPNRNLDKEIEMTQKIIHQITGKQPHLFRPPEGVYNDSILGVVKKHNLKFVMWGWDQDTKDWGNRKKSQIVNQVIKNASNGDIVLFHDSKMKTVHALKEILPELKKQGYQFVTVSQLLQEK